MADKKAEQATAEEPSIEEILESIRQIISDDDEDGDDAGDVIMDVEADKDKAGDVDLPKKDDDDKPADIEGDVTEQAVDDGDVLELRDVVEEGGAADISMDAADDDYEPADIEGDMTDADDSRLISEDTEEAAVGAMAKLAENMFVEEHTAAGIAPAGRVTLEHITRELLRPMLKEWLDRRLPGLVEELVEREIKKISDRSKK
jgi:hypothetical protein